MFTAYAPILRVILIMLGAVLAICFTYHLLKAFLNVHEDKRRMAAILGPFCLLVPTLFTEKGNRHRVLFGNYALGFAVCFLLLFLFERL